MRLAVRALAVLVLGGTISGCTFYTCPSTHCGDTPNSGGNGSGGGGNAGNGSSGTGGAGGFAGAPKGDWTNVTNNLAGLDTMCGNTGLIAAKPDQDLLIAAVALHGLWSSSDGGQNWTAIKSSAALTASASVLVFDPSDSGHYWVAGNHLAPYLFTTTNDGKTFTTPGDGSYLGLDHISVDFTDPKRKLQVVGWHESAQSLSLSADAGVTWKAIGKKLPAGVFCSAPLLVDADTITVGCVDGQMQRTTDGGGSWGQIKDIVGSNRAPLQASDGTVYWSGIDGSLSSTNDGGETWAEVLPKGSLAQPPIPPIELPDGRIAVVIDKDNGIAVGNKGKTWTLATQPLPSSPWTIAYSSQQQAFFYGHGDCTTAVPDDAIESYPFDYTKN